MTRKEVIELEKLVLSNLAKRKSLGNYNADSESILFLHEALATVLGILKRSIPRKQVGKL